MELIQFDDMMNELQAIDGDKFLVFVTKHEALFSGGCSYHVDVVSRQIVDDKISLEKESNTDG